MTHQIPDAARRLIDRLRMLADELEAAAGYGVPVPIYVTASGHENGHVHIPMTAAEFDAWVEHTDANVRVYHHDGARWRSAKVDLDGLAVGFATCDEDGGAGA